MTNGTDTAFPSNPASQAYSGLTIREHFAAMAMQGLIASRVNTSTTFSPDYDGILCCEYADALIEALNKEGK